MRDCQKYADIPITIGAMVLQSSNSKKIDLYNKH